MAHQNRVSGARRVECANEASIRLWPDEVAEFYRVGSCYGPLFFLASKPFEVRGYRTSSPLGAAWRGRNIKRELMWENTHTHAGFVLSCP